MALTSAMVNAIETARAEGYVKTKFFVYNRTEQTVTTAGVSDNFLISNVSDFLLWYLVGTCYQPAGTNVPNPDFLVQLQDSNTGWMFSDNPVHWGEIIGTAQNPFILPDPRLLEMNSIVNFILTNQMGATQAQVNVGLAGLQIFYYQGFSRADLPVQL